MTLSHISQTLPGALASGKPKTLHDLRHRFAAEEALEFDDLVVPTRALEMTPEGFLQVPQLGHFAFNDWSRRQCASLVGIRWDRWFENADPAVRAEEMTRRFARADGSVKLRTTSHVADPTACHGTLLAILSPSYTPIADSTVAGLLVEALRPLALPLVLTRAEKTTMTATYVVTVGKTRGDRRVGDLSFGILVRNSSVGYASLLVSLHMTRLICLNGMVVEGSLCVKRRHRGLDTDRLRAELAEGLHDLDHSFPRVAESLAATAHERVDDVPTLLTELLRVGRLPSRHLPLMLSAYEAEPEPTMFGVMQALTRGAQSLSSEERHDVEALVGRRLAAVSSLN